MKKKLSITIAFLGILLAFSSCQAIKLSKQSREPNTSLLVINGIYGLHSIDLMLENRETHEKYETKKLVGLEANSVICNLPKGSYDVVKLWLRIDIGNSEVELSNWSPELKEYFGPIEIEPNNKYFLGIYECKKDYDIRLLWTVRDQIKLRYKEPGSEKHIGLGQDYVPKKIQIIVSETDWKDGEFILLRPAKYDEVFDFY